MSRAGPQGIIVVGAGIVGASLAYHLASKGAQVTVVEAGGIASGVTGTSFAWINTSCAGPDPIAALRGGAIAAWRQLEMQVPGLTVRWHGALSYGTQNVRVSPESIMIDRSRIARLEPQLRQPPEQALYEPEQGALDAVAATHALLAAARALGVARPRARHHFQTCNGSTASRRWHHAGSGRLCGRCAGKPARRHGAAHGRRDPQ